jgi:hypothetical protein
MPFERMVDVDAGVLVVIFTGEVTGADFAEETAEQVRNPPLEPPYNQLYDLREARFVGDLSELKAHASRISSAPWPKGQRCAQLVDEGVGFGLTRLFDARAAGGPVEYRVFTDESEARKWVGLPPLPDSM